MATALDRFADNLPLRRDRSEVSPQLASVLLIQLGVDRTDPDQQAISIEKWLVDHDPSPRLRRSLKQSGFGHLVD